MRLGRMAIGGLEGDEAARKAVMFETEGEAPIRLTGRDAEQPTFRAQPLDELGDALIKRLVHQPVPAQPLEDELVITGKGAVAFGNGVGKHGPPPTRSRRRSRRE